MKNIIILHLESVSKLIMNKFKFPNLEKLINDSYYYENYFSSATSTVISISDLLYGDTFGLDKGLSFDNTKMQTDKKDLLTILKENGYNCRGLGYPPIWRDDINKFDIIDQISWINLYEEFLSNIEKAQGNKPYCLLLMNVISHIMYGNKAKDDFKNSYLKIENGYKQLDEFIGWLFNNIDITNTIILGVGDHGDEYCFHGLNKGFFHSMEPYTSLIRVPFLIYGIGKGINDSLISSIDIKSIMLKLILNKEDSKRDKYDGYNSLGIERKNVFSRNLFANQEETKRLIKGYAITNKNYHLIANKNGLRLYMYRLDPINVNNLLDLFDKNFNLKYMWQFSHFNKFFSKDQIDNIRDNFNLLKQELYTFVKYKNTFAPNNPFNLKILE